MLASRALIGIGGCVAGVVHDVCDEGVDGGADGV